MEYRTGKIPLLKNILWADHLLGAVTAVTGLLWHELFSHILGIPVILLIIISAITLAYANLALVLALQKQISQVLLRILVKANWIWAIISVFILFYYFNDATQLGAAFLILQVIVVALLAYLEGKFLGTY